MAEAAISAVLSKLAELAVSEARILHQVGDDIVLLRDQLEWLQAFIRDADRRRRAGTDGLTRVWVCQTRDVAFDAEDALDDFFYEEAIGPKGQGLQKLRPVISFSVNLKGDVIPSCVFTDPSLQSLQTMVLHGNVDWNDITANDLRKVRPNLLQLKLHARYQQGAGHH